MTIDSKWQESFILECRLRDYTGEAIGAALAEIESHCASANETAQEAFGDPVEYAASLNLQQDTSGVGSTLASGAFGIAALTVLPAGILGLVRGKPAVLTSGQLIVFGIILALVALIAVGAKSISRALLTSSPWKAAVASMALIGVWVGIMFLAPNQLQINAALLTAIGAVAQLGSIGAGWASGRPDPITSPLEAKPGGAGSRWLSVLLWPMLTAVFTGLALAL